MNASDGQMAQRASKVASRCDRCAGIQFLVTVSPEFRKTLARVEPRLRVRVSNSAIPTISSPRRWLAAFSGGPRSPSGYLAITRILKIMPTLLLRQVISFVLSFIGIPGFLCF